ncbi:MAG TPA: RluA family pseudouridine synthase, partial [Anaerolineales bacterium]|nr:RluA family pseudouridine synthase [Anaerolineales bacterium]
NPRLDDHRLIFRYELGKSARLDKVLVSELPEFSRTRLQALIENGYITVDGSVVYKSGLLIRQGATIQVIIPPPEPSDLVPEAIPLHIVFENADLMVVNKPAGMVVHPAAGHFSGTLVHAALAHAPEMVGIGGEKRPGVVHRLDRDTSGLILLAKNDQAHRLLQDQFRLRKSLKTYIALVDGKPPTPFGRIEAPVGRDPKHRKLMTVMGVKKGREAVSEYRTLETFKDHTLLEVHPLTGRTHQIRVHLKFIGCPVAGDTVYGHRHPTIDLDRQFLHAARLTILLPGQTTPRTFEAPLPDELERILEQLRSEK